MDVTLDQVRTLLVASFGVGAEEVGAEVTLAELDVDSLALVEFALMAEKEFGVAIDEEEISKDFTMGDVVTLIERKKALV
ncbi:acyl carrier protein [Actinokineospora sp. HUAS TT18]|uniref:acyl carrier protein n=1 Tax=Actinokineospora sp. HUAS TT18 TaxID=3447451 RepID=UPI003F521866